MVRDTFRNVRYSGGDLPDASSVSEVGKNLCPQDKARLSLPPAGFAITIRHSGATQSGFPAEALRQPVHQSPVHGGMMPESSTTNRLRWFIRVDPPTPHSPTAQLELKELQDRKQKW